MLSRSSSIRIVLLFAALVLPPGMKAQPANGASDPVGSDMPVAAFDGWRQQHFALQTPASSDAAALTEFGLKEASVTTFARGGHSLTATMFKFPDATGAYGAFTYFRQPQMRVETIGSGGASSGSHYLFWTGATLIDANFDRTDSRSVRDLNALAAALPKPSGPESIAPTLPGYLPAQDLDPASVHYSLGPAAYAHDGGVLPVPLIDFSKDAEVVSGGYRGRGGSGTLTLINYPTPQLAVDRERAFAAALKASAAGLGAGDSDAVLLRRAGPLLAITTGRLAPAEAHRLLDEIHYNAGIVWSNTLAGSGEAKKTASLLLSIAYLTIVLALGALVLGVFFGGGRALLRIARGKPVSTMNDEDFISLKLGR